MQHQLTTFRRVGGQEIEVPAKPWYQSLGIWVGILTTGAGVLTFIEANSGLSLTLMVAGILQIIARSLSATAIVPTGKR